MTPPVHPALERFHPIVARWFAERLGEPSAPQQAGWPAIAHGSDTLILAPTGTGKTLAAFLYELDALIKEGVEAPLANAVHLLYVSPLKALSNDVQRNLEGPLAELKGRFERAGERFPEIRVAVRTGDTKASARAKMLRKTPHILITTPESLHILLTSVKGRTMFSALRAVIVDEIHAVAGTKRGAHLALTLERLARVAPDAPQRIGLSATQRPLDEIARFLGGCSKPREGKEEGRFRPVEIVDCGLVKRMETRVVSPVPDLAHVDGTIWNAVVPLLLQHIRGARTTLVFVNNRGQAEKMAARVNQLAGSEMALPYHGSLSRERRLMLEERLKAGELRALVTTSSLELGIDVGSVDLVVQLQSPKRVSSALQRVGRAGHSLAAVSRGVFVPTFRDDALEELAIVQAMREGDVEPTHVVQNALDVLAQIVVAIVASERPAWTASALFDFVRGAYPFHSLTRGAFDEVLAMLAGRYPSDLASELDARVHWDRVSDELTPARSSRLVATVSGGTIPDRGLYTVNLPDRTRLGELDEEFVHESRVGDAFQLGSSTWRIRSIEHDRVVVAPAPGAPARMPFWHGEFMARSRHLASRVGALRRKLDEATTLEALGAIEREYDADEATVRSLAEYVQAQRAATGVVPDEKRLVLEQFRDEAGSVRLVLHAPFGGRVNAPWGMALARRMRERLGVDVQVLTTDDGLMLRLPDMGVAPPLDAITSLGADEGERLVIDEVGSSSVFGARFRMNAARALLLPRGNARRRMPLWLQRLKAADLLQSVRPYASFPIVVETYRDVLQEAFDIAAMREVLTGIATGAIRIRAAQTEVPSPFAASLQFGFVMDWMYGDDTPRAEARSALLSLDRALLDELMGGEGADAETVAVVNEVVARKRGTAPGRQARDADELAVLVDRVGDVTAGELAAMIAPSSDWSRGDPRATLLASGRLVGVTLDAGDDEPRWILVDAWPRYAAAFGESMQRVLVGEERRAVAVEEAIPPALRTVALTRGAARREIVARHLATAGVVSVASLVERYPLPERWLERRLEEWERAGTLVRGAYGGDRSTPRWCSRRLLEQARRRELAQARKQVAAVSFDVYARFMLRWQHLETEHRLSGPDAVSHAIDQLQGIARPADSWERDILPARVAGYTPALLDALAASGRLVWAVDPPTSQGSSQGSARSSGTLGRVRFFERGTGRLWLRHRPDGQALSAPATAVRDALRANGASFTSDLLAVTVLGPQRLRDALRELVAAGVVTNDTVGALRDVMRWRPVFAARRDDDPDPTRWLPADFSPSPNRRIVQRRVNPRSIARWRRPDRPGANGWGGRWSLLHTPGTLGGAPEEELGDAEAVARQWLARYGIVSRDLWKRERPAVSWRELYHVLKRMEYRGDVRRGYFVAGLAGAQFALADAVELLRATAAAGDDAASEALVVAASDPASLWSTVDDGSGVRDPMERPRGSGALLGVVGGTVVAVAEGGGKRLRTRGEAPTEAVRNALVLLVARLAERRGRSGRRADVVVETIDGERAATSPWGDTLRAVGFRGDGAALRLHPEVR